MGFGRMVVLVAFACFLAGCTSITVEPVEKNITIRHICIEDNPAVKIEDIHDVFSNGFLRHGINSSVVDKQQILGCEFILRYTALRSWDFVPYLSVAELWLYQRQRQIGYAEYHLRWKGGLSLMKWSGTKSKLDPVMDKLLADRAD